MAALSLDERANLGRPRGVVSAANRADSARLDFLDAICGQANADGGPARGWTIHIAGGVVSLSCDGLRIRPVREVIDEFFVSCNTAVRIKAEPARTEIFGMPVEASPAVPRGCVMWRDEATREIVISNGAGFERRVRADDLRADALLHETRAAALAEDADVLPGEK